MEQRKDNTVDMYYWEMCLHDDGKHTYLKGSVMGHPYIEDRHVCYTSKIVGLVFSEDFVLFTTKNNTYRCRFADCEQITDPLMYYPEVARRVETSLLKKELQERDFLENLDLQEKDVCLFVSTLKKYYIEKAYAILDGKIVKCSCGVHVGTFQDSVMINATSHAGKLDYAFFPYIDGRMEFYSFPNDHIYVVNTGFEDMEIDVPFGKFLVKAGETEKIYKENGVAQIEESIADPIDRYSMLEELIVDGKMIGYKGIPKNKEEDEQ